MNMGWHPRRPCARSRAPWAEKASGFASLTSTKGDPNFHPSARLHLRRPWTTKQRPSKNKELDPSRYHGEEWRVTQFGRLSLKWREQGQQLASVPTIN